MKLSGLLSLPSKKVEVALWFFFCYLGGRPVFSAPPPAGSQDIGERSQEELLVCPEPPDLPSPRFSITLPHAPPQGVSLRGLADQDFVTEALQVEKKLEKMDLFGGVATWELHPEQERRIRLKKIPLGAYDGPRDEDFLRRFTILLETMQYHCQNQWQRPSEAEQKERCEQKTLDIAQPFIQQIDTLLTQLRPLWPRMRLAFEKNEASPIFDKAYQETKKILYNMAQAWKALAQARLLPTYRPENLKKWEAVYLGSDQHHRPHLIHEYEVEAPSLTPVPERQVFISSHRLWSESPGAFLPSGLRNQVGLPNAIDTSFYSKSTDGKKVHPLFSATRHASFSPIGIRQAPLRRALAMHHVDLYLKHLTQKFARESPGQCPKTLSLSTLMLLTPEKSWIANRRGQESERDQIEETHLSLRAHHGHLLQLPNCPTSTLLETHFINIPTNDWGSKPGKKEVLLDESLLHQTNARGIVTFQNNMQAQLIHHLSLLENLLSEQPKLIRQSLQEDLKTLREQYTQKQNEIEKGPLFHQLNAQEASIRQYYLLLHLKQTQCEKGTHSVSPLSPFSWAPSCLKEWNNIYQKIFYSEKEVAKTYQKIEQQQHREWKKKPSLDTLERMLVKQLHQVALQKPPASTRSLLENTQDLLQLFADFKKMYFQKEYQNPVHRLDLQRTLLLAQSRLGHWLDFFCKSAEDRTGKVNNEVEAALIFKQQFGFFPPAGNISQDQTSEQQPFQRIQERVYHGSASRDTAGENNPGARGLQFEDAWDSQAIRWDKKMGDLPKATKKKYSFF